MTGDWNTVSSTDPIPQSDSGSVDNSCLRKNHKSAGFTLVELLVVLVVLGLLAGLAGPRLISIIGDSRSDAANLQMSQFKQILDLYRLDVANYPTTQQGLQALVEKPNDAERWNGPYTDSIPKDPWGNDYIYQFPGDQGDYDLSSLGADNRPGGDGENADITSWK